MSTNTTFEVHPTRSVFDASRTALGALILRDLVVLWKTKREFVLRTLIQPFLLCFVFLFVFPKIGQAVGGSSAVGAAGFATVLVPVSHPPHSPGLIRTGPFPLRSPATG